MKKTCFISILFSFAFWAVAVMPADAQITGPIDHCTLVRDVEANGKTYNKGSIIDAANPAWGAICIVNSINTIIDWAFILLLVVAVGVIVIAGFMMIISRGDSTMTGAAGKMVGAVLVGIVIVLLARMIPAIVTGILL